MQKSKIFVKKTRKGGIIKIVREHYLRDDIWCGSEGCTQCENETPVLSSNPEMPSTLCDYPHYLILDTNVVLHQMDVIQDDVFKNIILLQTVLQEVKHQSYTAYKRIREVIAMKQKCAYVFSNEHHIKTFTSRQKGETANDYNDRCIRVATSYLGKHIGSNANKGNEIKVVLLTNDKLNQQKAHQEGINAFTVDEYVKNLNGHSYLIDKLAKTVYLEKNEGNAIFPEHLPLSDIQNGVKSGKYLQGTFFASRENYMEATVRVPGRENEIFLQGLKNLNRAIQDDIVAVEMLPENEWVSPSSLILEEKDEELDEEVQDKKIEDELKKQVKKHIKETGKVVGIIKRNWRPYCGMLSPNGNIKGLKHMFIAANRQIPRIMIESRQGELLQQKKIIVSIDCWPRNSRYPLGHYVRDLGESGNKATEKEVLLLEHDVPHQPFSQHVLDDLPKLPWCITEQDYLARHDLRELNICSIDPPGCTDIDDALHWRPLENGNFECGVHIADVSHFVKPGTHLDEEAKQRGTTVYLVDQRIDMIPELLSSDLCSLHEKEERFAFSCIWEMTPDAEIVNVNFAKSVICSKAALTYAEAQMIIDDNTRVDPIAISVRNLNELAKKLKAKRIEFGALTLASPEVRFHIDSETHDPIDMQKKELRDTNSLVEEFMLLANISVAKKLYEHFPQHSVLRKHPTPSAAMFETLIKSAASLNVPIDISSGKSLQNSLDAAIFEDDPYKNIMLRILSTRSMTQALYFCSGTEKFSDYQHYGLATPIYTHFTSPIRRYPDIMVHRLLGVACGAYQSSSDLLNKTSVQSITSHMNHRHKMAQYAARASINLHTQIYFKNRICDEIGYVLFVRKNALQILIPKYGLEGTVYLSSNKDAESPFRFDEESLSQTFGNVTIKVFDKVIVQVSIEKKTIQTSEMKLKLVRPEIPGLSVPAVGVKKVSNDEPVIKKSRVSED
ncbi:exosome complex exonuclease RRP44 isoform X2 [Hydra vulgaris]|uniref:Exosome complex exonuclease RRP44 isoform X2 n=1 Tax=Hydra vulgaris TaxID=6087 RepID=A0ABM4D387_HYDVU